MKDIYIVQDVAEITGLEPDTIRRAIQTGTLKAERLGGRYIISKEALEDYLEYRERRCNGK